MQLVVRDFQNRFNSWLLRFGLWPVTITITAISIVLSVLMTWIGNALFMPDVPWEEWFYISAIVPALITPPVCSAVLSLLYQLAEARAALVRMSETDPLMGVGNRRHFVAQAQRAIDDAGQSGEPLSIVLIDIDHFKRINDTHGHAVGDDVLVMVARACQQSLRAEDVFCRWGGEEFIALLPGATLDIGSRLAERLRKAVEGAATGSIAAQVTISLGVAELGPTETLENAIVSADRHLYRAKDGGRNRVEPAGWSPAAIAS